MLKAVGITRASMGANAGVHAEYQALRIDILASAFSLVTYGQLLFLQQLCKITAINL